jgi:hypothetical protein
VRVTDTGFTATRTLHIAVAVPLVVTSRTTLPVAHQGRLYVVLLTASGGSGTRTWALTSGPLPAGLRLSSTGRLSGRATHLGTVRFTVRVRDAAGRSTLKRLTVVVRP